MNLYEIAKAIGIENYEGIPEEMLRYYPIPEERKGELCSLEMIEHLQERLDFFGDYIETVKACWRELEQDELRKTYLDVASLLMKDEAYEIVRKIEIPEQDGALVNDFLPLFIHVPAVEQAYESYLSRGFPDEEARKYMRNYISCVALCEREILFRPALTKTYFSWQCLYTKSCIFSLGGFNFELHKFANAYILRNRKDGSLVPLCADKAIHSSGLILGSAGLTDEEGSYMGTFTETEDAYIGYPAVDGIFPNEEKVYPKTEWEMAMQPGDDCFGIHIPKGADISEAAFGAALDSCREYARKRYLDWKPKMFTCASWLLSYELKGMLKPGSRILGFGNCFTRYPIKDAGKNCISFAFPKSFKGPWEDLPEDTSLRRAIKQQYVAGKFVYMYGGVIEV